MQSGKDKTKDDETWLLYSKSVKRVKPRKKTVHTEVKTRISLKPKTNDPRPLFEAEREISINEKNLFNFGAVLDKNKARKIRQGKEKIEDSLDLHGMKQQEAYKALQHFIFAQAKRGKRNLLVITGKGKAGQSVLKTNFPRWCAVSPLSELILAVTPSAIKHGGDGAWYVLLRKREVVK